MFIPRLDWNSRVCNFGFIFYVSPLCVFSSTSIIPVQGDLSGPIMKSRWLDITTLKMKAWLLLAVLRERGSIEPLLIGVYVLRYVYIARCRQKGLWVSKLLDLLPY
ncbi:hypothetical protein EV426DRAFT_621297 [Tirmania nivea]|nr:hypothetical protein EV426DRAFT_621297 [Tirmania nivea]